MRKNGSCRRHHIFGYWRYLSYLLNQNIEIHPATCCPTDTFCALWEGRIRSRRRHDHYIGAKKQIKIRLFGIDAPELKQPYGKKSKQFLSNLIAGQIVEVKENGNDRYGRTIGTVSLNGEDINAQMVESGYAWAYRRFSKKYAPKESAAKFEKRGLWRDDPIPPWVFRR